MTGRRPATDRFVTRQPGITTWHSFSAGAHYDPANIAFGPVLGSDEHHIEPGAGFDRHPHRGVVVVSWVLEGTLRHEDDGGEILELGPGDGLLVQCTGSGIVHRETNPSTRVPLRLVQTTLLLDLDRSVAVRRPPFGLGTVGVDVVRDAREVGPGYVTVAGPDRAVAGAPVAPGDSLRLTSPVLLEGTGAALVIGFDADA